MTTLLDDPARPGRRAMLALPHVAALALVRAGIAASGRRVPHPVPLDGGVGARLLLLETPGLRMGHPAIVSRDNRTGTGAYLRRFLPAAGIARGDTLIRNAVPWIVHRPYARSRPMRRAESREGLALLPAFLALRPRLAVVMLAGVPLLFMPHPGPTIMRINPAVGGRIAATLPAAAALAG